jgi:hypothetical protein
MARLCSAGNNLSAGNPTSLQISGSEITVFAFCDPTSLPAASNQIVICKRGSAISTISWELGFWNRKLRFATSDAVTNYEIVESAALAATPGPLFIVGHKQAGFNRVYINSLASVVAAAAPTNIASTSAALAIGRYGGTDEQAFVGRIAEAAVWNKALSGNELDALLHGVCPLHIRRDFLRGYWPLFGLGSPEADLSGSGANASLLGSPTSAAHPPVGKLAA